MSKTTINLSKEDSLTGVLVMEKHPDGTIVIDQGLIDEGVVWLTYLEAECVYEFLQKVFTDEN